MPAWRSSRTCTDAPRRASSCATAHPTIPAPTTATPAGREAIALPAYRNWGRAATALCINMHNYWVGTAADVWRSGDTSVEWILREAADGEVFAAGHAEHGNETSIVMSITKAEKVPGGYTFTGRKSFGSLTPVW